MSSLFFLFLSVISFFINLKMLRSYNEPSGADGYFYLKQILSLSRDGVFYFPDKSLAFLLPTTLNFFIHNELLSYQISISLVLFLYQWAFWLLTSRFIKDSPQNPTQWVLLAPTVFALSACNFAFYELSFIYYKTAFALVLFIFGMSFYWRSTKSLRSLQLWLSLFLLFLSLLTHKTALILLFCFVIAHVQWNKKWFFTFLFFICASVFFFFIFYSRSAHYLVFLSQMPLWGWADFAKWYQWAWHKHQWHIVLGPAWVLFSLLCFTWWRNTPQRGPSLLLVLLGTLTWFPLLPHDLDSPAYRLVLLFSALASTWVCALVFIKIKNLPLKSVFSILIISSSFALFKWGPSLHGFFKNYSKMDDQVQRLENFVAANDHLTCHHGLEFYVDYHTHIRCRSFLPDNPTQKAWRLVWAPLQKGPWTQARIELNQKAATRLGKDYFLVTEDFWVQLREYYKLPTHWRNPSKYRPDHIQK